MFAGADVEDIVGTGGSSGSSCFLEKDVEHRHTETAVATCLTSASLGLQVLWLRGREHACCRGRRVRLFTNMSLISRLCTMRKLGVTLSRSGKKKQQYACLGEIVGRSMATTAVNFCTGREATPPLGPWFRGCQACLPSSRVTFETCCVPRHVMHGRACLDGVAVETTTSYLQPSGPINPLPLISKCKGCAHGNIPYGLHYPYIHSWGTSSLQVRTAL